MTQTLDLPPASETMIVREVPMNEIYLDNAFNCRGRIAPFDVMDLAKDIKRSHGLLQAIVLQPYDKKPGKKWRIVAGHRRFVANQVNERPVIEATIVTNLLDDLSAKTLNLAENIKRKSLNIKQEALALTDYVKYGWRNKDIAEELEVTTAWLNPRIALLRLPEDVQDEAALDMFTVNQIVALSRIEDREKLYETVKKIKRAHERNESFEIKDAPRKPRPFSPKRRTPQEVFALQDLIRETFGNSLVTVALGWCAGFVSDYELYCRIGQLAKEEGLDFKVPDKLQDAINGVT